MNPLNNAIPAKYRKYTYALGFVGGLAYTAYSAAGGDVKQAVGGFVGSLVAALAASNTPSENDAN